MALALFTAGALAQPCDPQWLASDAGMPGTNGPVNALVAWDPDGGGPRGPVLVVAGDFQVAGTLLAGDIATFDPATGLWETLGQGFGPGPTAAMALEVDAAGALVAGGSFTTADGAPIPGIARWTGTSWTGIAGGVGGQVRDILRLPNGDLVVGGLFNDVDGMIARNVARWNGVEWSAFGDGLSNGRVNAVARLANGDLVAAGAFTISNGIPINRVAR